ncbi:MAG: hypothetical protein IT375_14135 [Polyangiaceae bacterium]|nr:hypothetical protein [Polyangiaceae bacterium]
MTRVLRALVLLAAACNPTPSAAPSAEPVRSPPPSASAGCVEACVARRQMQAVSPQQIEATCRAACAGDAG